MSNHPTYVSFDGIAFHQMAPAGRVPDWVYGKRIVSEHVPGSDLEFTQQLGSPHARLSIHVEFDSIDEFQRMKRLEGEWSNLILLAFTVTMPADNITHWRDQHYALYRNTMLESVSDTQIQLDRLHPVECNLTFRTEARR